MMGKPAFRSFLYIFKIHFFFFLFAFFLGSLVDDKNIFLKIFYITHTIMLRNNLSIFFFISLTSYRINF